jgi:sugar phosphate isomerase/epimerase
MDKKISMSLIDLQRKGDRYAIDAAKRIGLDGIDLYLGGHSVDKEGDIYALGKDAVIEYYSGIKAYAESVGIEISQTHGRLAGYGYTDESTRLFVRNTELDCLATRILGAKYCVVHTPSVSWVPQDTTDDDMRALGDSMFREILPFAKREGVKIAAETHGYCVKYEKKEYFGLVDNLIAACERAMASGEYKDHLCVCIDTGHTNMTVRHEHLSVGDFIRRCGSLVEVLHMHDNAGITDEHKIPMTGIIDWEDVLSALDEIGYGGWYNLENSLEKFGKGIEEDVAYFSVKVLKNMLRIHYKNRA